jgi:hypothetical protein
MRLPGQQSEAFASVMRAKSNAANTALTLAARVNDAQLKRQALGKLPEILKLIQDEEKRGIEAAVS